MIGEHNDRKLYTSGFFGGVDPFFLLVQYITQEIFDTEQQMLLSFPALIMKLNWHLS